ncbi:glycosyltransferase family 2 protein [Sandarakinorhabdus sp. AAP62]|uniref:glycosyltransferase family 2 protein n=1 Tax=Sandarakinorhabdus sp. AAP62 TaxID=1248916 RepID=UPI0003110936|nr:glycosyltransferase family 2 protein [Sandarakinorhabdus sp. AAP62]
MQAAFRPKWVIVIAFYNEANYIAPTVQCALTQDRDDICLVCVDNASTDASPQIVADAIKGNPRAILVTETNQGHTFALRRGLAIAQELGAENIAFWDADTFYPPHYISRADELLGKDPGVVGVQAFDIYGPYDSLKNRIVRHRMALTASLLTGQGHTGTFGQCFRIAPLVACGGPKSDAWPFVLYDHELIHRILKQGRLTHAADHVCWPAPRRQVKGHVRWNLVERLTYALTPYAVKDWFFYAFLAPRLRARGMFEAGLRVRDWEQ